MADDAQSSERSARLLLAVLVPPIPSLALTFLLADLVQIVATGASAWTNHWGIGVLSLLGALVAYPAAICLGVPGHLLLTRFNRRDVFSYAALGALAGLLALAVATNFKMSWSPSGPAVFAAAEGMINAGLFWLIRRPDRDAPAPSSRTREA